MFCFPLTYSWISQLSTHNLGISTGERVVTDCAPLIIVADLHSAIVYSESTTHKTNSTIGTRGCSTYRIYKYVVYTSLLLTKQRKLL